MIQLIYNSLYSYDNFGIIAKTVNRPLLPAMRRSEVVIPGRHGSYDFGDNTYDNIVIPVVIQYISETFEDLRTRARNIAVWLSQTSYKPLIFTDEPDKYYLAKIYDAASVDKIVELVPGEKTTINFECQPLAFSITEDLWEDRITTVAKTIQNGGTYEAFPIIKITPIGLSGGMDRAVEVTGAFDPGATALASTLTNPAITIGDKTLVYTDTIVAGQTLEIDTGAYQAVKAGSNVLSKISGEWPVLAKGSNNISLVDTTSECGAIVEMTFRKRWL